MGHSAAIIIIRRITQTLTGQCLNWGGPRRTVHHIRENPAQRIYSCVERPWRLTPIVPPGPSADLGDVHETCRALKTGSGPNVALIHATSRVITSRKNDACAALAPLIDLCWAVEAVMVSSDRIVFSTICPKAFAVPKRRDALLVYARGQSDC